MYFKIQITTELKSHYYFSGNVRDALSYHKDTAFSTKDSDDEGNCAAYWQGAWWYKNCYYSNLNGKNLAWLGFNNVKTSEIKIKP